LRRRLKARWNDDTLVELSALIAFQNLSAKFNSALDVPAQGFCRAARGLGRQTPHEPAPI
jgi:hypothetical protein